MWFRDNDFSAKMQSSFLLWKGREEKPSSFFSHNTLLFYVVQNGNELSLDCQFMYGGTIVYLANSTTEFLLRYNYQYFHSVHGSIANISLEGYIWNRPYKHWEYCNVLKRTGTTYRYYVNELVCAFIRLALTCERCTVSSAEKKDI